MVFSSLQFVFLFLPAFLSVYYLVPERFRNLILFVGSMGFYTVGAWHEPIYIAYLFMAVLVNYLAGLLIEGGKHKTLWLSLGLIYDLGWLFVFKYADFFSTGINLLLQKAGSSFLVPSMELSLPIGISFYTFQAISYLVDVKRGDIHAELSFINYGAYLTMFPQLIAGPIVTYASVEDRLNQRTYSFYAFVDGFKVFILGLGLKVLLANRLGGLWSSLDGIGYDFVSTPLAWAGILAYTFQLYFDFFGYSLMAIGLGKMLGFDFPQNFDHPYTSVSMTEFWRRWHMTLGSWFKNYVYIPLGGSRKGKRKTYRNLFIVWALTGLWHGAHLNFVLWGMCTFVLIAIEKTGFLDVVEKHRGLGHVYMILVIPLMWALFAITDFSQLGIFFARLFPFFGEASKGALTVGSDFSRLILQYGPYLAVGVLFSTKLPYRWYGKCKDNIVGSLLLVGIFWGSVYCMYKGLNDPFLYFRY